jgi:hypothetical protein
LDAQEALHGGDVETSVVLATGLTPCRGSRPVAAMVERTADHVRSLESATGGAFRRLRCGRRLAGTAEALSTGFAVTGLERAIAGRATGLPA